MAKKRGLGRGLDALLGEPKKPASSAPGLDEIPVEWIQPGKYQPRRVIDDEALQELAASIRVQGVIQPIVVRSVSENRYEIIAGERRWRATQIAGLSTIAAVIKEVNDESAVAISLIENIQREDLNPMEEALALQRLIEEFKLTHQQVADAVGKSRTAVTNFLRLFNLSPEVAEMLVHGDIEMGHARSLLSLTFDKQGQVAREIAARHLNVRQAEAIVRTMLSGTAHRKLSRKVDADTRQLEDRLSTTIGQPVAIQHSAKGKGKLIIKYNSLDELDGILNRFGDLG